MRLVGFNFKKISVERKKESVRDAKINSKINIESIEELKSGALKNEEAILKINFDYGVDYTPDMAKIELAGSFLLSLVNEQAKEIISTWKKKQIPEKFKMIIFNIILRKSNVKALELEDDMNLPLHIPFPTLKKQEEREKPSS